MRTLSPSERNSRGSRTAWLRLFWNSLATSVLRMVGTLQLSRYRLLVYITQESEPKSAEIFRGKRERLQLNSLERIALQEPFAALARVRGADYSHSTGTCLRR